MKKNKKRNGPPCSLKKLESMLSYDEEIGRLRWKVSRGKAKSGQLAGCKVHENRWRIKILGKMYLSSNIIFFLKEKRWPKASEEIDHINGDPSDDRWSNLRIVPIHVNHANRVNRKKLTSKFVGVFKRKKGKHVYWCAKVEKGGVKEEESFPFTKEGEADAAMWRNLKMYELYGDLSMYGIDNSVGQPQYE